MDMLYNVILRHKHGTDEGTAGAAISPAMFRAMGYMAKMEWTYEKLSPCSRAWAERRLLVC